MLRRLFNDKEIGRRIILNQKKMYGVSSNDWDVYNNIVCLRYSRNYTNPSPTSITSNYISSLNHEHDIKAIKLDVLKLHSKINELTNIVDKNKTSLDEKINLLSNDVYDNHKELGEVLVLLATQVKNICILLKYDENTKK
jgi:hypothetical protein